MYLRALINVIFINCCDRVHIRTRVVLLQMIRSISSDTRMRYCGHVPISRTDIYIPECDRKLFINVSIKYRGERDLKVYQRRAKRMRAGVIKFSLRSPTHVTVCLTQRSRRSRPRDRRYRARCATNHRTSYMRFVSAVTREICRFVDHCIGASSRINRVPRSNQVEFIARTRGCASNGGRAAKEICARREIDESNWPANIYLINENHQGRAFSEFCWLFQNLPIAIKNWKNYRCGGSTPEMQRSLDQKKHFEAQSSFASSIVFARCQRRLSISRSSVFARLSRHDDLPTDTRCGLTRNNACMN